VRMPAFVKEREFVDLIAEFNDRIDYRSFLEGKPTSKQIEKKMSLCWLNFKNPADIAVFVRRYETTTFKGPSGPPLGLNIDYAMYQLVPRQQDPDTRMGVIEQNPEYLEFKQKYEQPVTAVSSTAAVMEAPSPTTTSTTASTSTSDAVSTPLVAAVVEIQRAREAAQKAKRGDTGQGRRKRRNRKKRGGRGGNNARLG